MIKEYFREMILVGFVGKISRKQYNFLFFNLGMGLFELRWWWWWGWKGNMGIANMDEEVMVQEGIGLGRRDRGRRISWYLR